MHHFIISHLDVHTIDKLSRAISSTELICIPSAIASADSWIVVHGSIIRHTSITVGIIIVNVSPIVDSPRLKTVTQLRDSPSSSLTSSVSKSLRKVLDELVK